MEIINAIRKILLANESLRILNAACMTCARCKFSHNYATCPNCGAGRDEQIYDDAIYERGDEDFDDDDDENSEN